MDLLSFLKEKKSELGISEHPYITKNVSFKYLYCLGLSAMSTGHMKAINELKSGFDNILESIKLPHELRDKFIIDINNNFDYKINEVLELLNTKEKQYTFTADLLMLSYQGLWSQQFCESVVDIYMSIFKLTNGEKEFLRKFTESTRKGNNDSARNAYNDFISNGYRISYKIITYISKNFVLTDYFKDINLSNGENLILDKPTEITGDIHVTNGSSLVIDGADIKIKGSIHIDGGRFKLEKGSITVLECRKKTLLTIKNTTAVSIYDGVINCDFKCGFINQEDGYLTINSSDFLHSKGISGITFKGKSLSMSNSNIRDCLNGGIFVTGESHLYVNKCKFDNCEGEQGGAIHSDSMDDTTISDSFFTNCRAKYLGGAVYFAYKKYGQIISGCEFSGCIPDDSVTFNQYINM